MSLTYLGSLTVGGTSPAAVSATTTALTELQAKLAGTLAAQASLTVSPPSISGNLTLASDMVTAITAQIAAGIVLPSVSLQLSVLAGLIAALNAQIGILLAFQTAFGSAGIHAYAFAGQANALGPAIPASFPGGGPADPVNALLLVTAIPASWAALGVVLKTS